MIILAIFLIRMKIENKMFGCFFLASVKQYDEKRQAITPRHDFILHMFHITCLRRWRIINNPRYSGRPYSVGTNDYSGWIQGYHFLFIEFGIELITFKLRNPLFRKSHPVEFGIFLAIPCGELTVKTWKMLISDSDFFSFIKVNRSKFTANSWWIPAAGFAWSDIDKMDKATTIGFLDLRFSDKKKSGWEGLRRSEVSPLHAAK